MISESVRLMPDIEAPVNPFPGLRPFEFDESHLFFGRDGQSEQLLRKLSSTRFVAVVGTSGSGKSSLVRAGLLPDLFGGFIASAGSNWRVGVMRPSNDPLGNLASVLASPDVFGSETKENAQLQATIIEATLRRGSLGLVEVARQHRMPSNENLLIVVDQFEELFRFARASRDERYNYEAASFVKLLLAATRQKEFAIYVVLTMRSDFLGDCSLFWELPEAINEGQYLIPRLTRDQRREAITGPVAVCGAEMTGRLVNRLLNDMGDAADQLPILQHALMRTWNKWKEETGERGAIDLAHYEAIGGMAEALSRHADEAYSELRDKRSREIAETIFKGLTEKGADNREIRRPVVLMELCALAQADAAEVKKVIEVFRQEGRTFLMPPASVPLNEDVLIDISHESLIRNWQTLKEWVDEEALSAQIYKRLAETAILYERGEAGLWRDPDLQIALNWREKTRPNQVWAKRYHPGFEAAMKFLDASVAARDAEVLEAERRRKRELRRARLTAIVFAIAFLFALAVIAYAINQRNIAQVKTAVAARALIETQKAREEAVKQKEIADQQREMALAQAGRAEEESKKAVAEQQNAEKQKMLAEEKKVEAEHAQARAETQAKIARDNAEKARVAQQDADKKRARALKEYENNSQLLYAADMNLAQQAYEANNIKRGRQLLEGYSPGVQLVRVEDLGTLYRPQPGFEWFYLRQLYNRASETLPEQEGEVNSVAFSPDGKMLATAISDGTIKLWDKTSHEKTAGDNKPYQPTATIDVIAQGSVKGVAFSPRGKMFATADSKAGVKLWRTDSPASPSVTLRLPEDMDFSFPALSNITFSPDGKRLALGVSAIEKASRKKAHRVLLWDTDSYQLLANRQMQMSYINSIAFSPDGRLLASSSSDDTVLVWNIQKDQSLLLSKDEGPSSIAFSPDGKSLVVGYRDGAVKLREISDDVHASMRLVTLTQQKSGVSYLAFAPGGAILAVGREDGTVQLLAQPEPNASYQDLTTLKGHTRAITSLTFSPDGRTLTSGSKDQTVKFWDTGAQVLKLFPRDMSSVVSTIALSADGSRLAISSINDVIKLCDVNSLQACTQWSNPTGAITSMALSPDGRRLAVGSLDKTVKVWNVGSSNNELIKLPGHTDIVNAIAFSPDKTMLATGGGPRDRTVRVWYGDAYTPKKSYQLPGDALSIYSVAFSPNSKVLAVGSGDGKVRLWGLNSNAAPIILEGFSKAVTSIAFSSDGKMLAAGSRDGTARLWNIASLEPSTGKPWNSSAQKIEELATLEGHAGAVNSVAFNTSLESITLATGGEDGTVKLWSTRSYKELVTLRGHARSVTSVVFGPYDRWLASGSYDKTVRFWYAAADDYQFRPRPEPRAVK